MKSNKGLNISDDHLANTLYEKQRCWSIELEDKNGFPFSQNRVIGYWAVDIAVTSLI